MSIEISSPSLVEFKGTTVPAVRVLLRSIDATRLRAALDATLGRSPDFFDDELAVADLSAIEDEGRSVDWRALIAALSDYGLRLVAVSNAPGALAASARAAGMSLVVIRAPTPARPVEVAPEPIRSAPEPEKPLPTQILGQSPTLIVERPLRSGQRIYACGADIVLLAMTSAGSEVIADGSIHVYAPLRGRALAGAHGDGAARIFTTSFEAELVSIAGVYRTFENGIPADIARRPAQVWLAIGEQGEQSLTVQPLSVS